MKEKRAFKCNNCDAIFARKSQLNGHMDFVHEGKKPFTCNVCDACFTAKRNLKRHVESVHEGRKPHK